MRSLSVSLTFGACLLALAACGPEEHHQNPGICGEHDEHDHIEPGMLKVSSSYECTLVSAVPEQPGEGFNVWELEVKERQTGVVRDDLTLTFTPFMPEHEHGPSPTTATFENGTYTSANLDYFMPGLWDVTVDLQDGETSESVLYTFCIE